MKDKTNCNRYFEVTLTTNIHQHITNKTLKIPNSIENTTKYLNYNTEKDHHSNTPFPDEGWGGPNTDPETTQCTKLVSTDPLNLKIPSNNFCVTAMVSPDSCRKIANGVSIEESRTRRKTDLRSLT